MKVSTLKQETVTKTIETKKQSITFWNALLAQRGLVAYLPIIAINILIFYFTSWQFLWLNTDPARYQCYALTYWMGSTGAQFLPAAQCSFLQISTTVLPPLHMLPLEYPPFALVIFSLPIFAPLSYYQLVFAVFMALVSTLIYWLLLRYGPRRSALAFVCYVLIGVLALVQERFDLVPAALTLLCLITAERKHWTIAYIALAFGFLIKIYPILFLPALFIAEQQDRQSIYISEKLSTLKSLPSELWYTLQTIRYWHWKNTLLFFSLVLGITGFFAIFNFTGAILSQVSYFANRPLQVESIDSTFLWLGTLIGFPVHIVFTFGSINVVGVLGGVVSNLSEVLFIAGYLYSIYLQWRGKLDIVQTCLALLLVFIATGKVFSPQYLIWLIPLLAYSGAFDVLWLVVWGSISLLTTIIYPYFYSRIIDSAKIPYLPGFIQIVSARNMLFVLLTLAYLLNWFSIRKRHALPINEKILGRQEESPSHYNG
jgi:Glycosyltransferase family 87